MRAFLRIVLVLLLFSLTVLFNIALIDVRIEEIQYLLGQAAESEQVSKSLGIVAKYELIKQRMDYGEESISNYELEARIQALTSGQSLKERNNPWTRRIYRLPLRMMINGMRFLLGKQIISPREDNQIMRVLEIAYFWERNRKYNEAIRIYGEVLEKPDVPPEVRATVMMHKSFCHSMLSEYDVSKKMYEEVINVYPSTEAGMLSWKLLDFIESMEKEREKVASRKQTNFEKAKQFYLLMDYRNAIRSFSVFLSDNPNSPLVPQARYYKGRSHEELGENEEATREYHAVIRNDASRRWAKQANRRMIMLGEFYETRKKVAQEARKRLDQYQDELFGEKVEQLASLVNESSLRQELLAEGATPKVKKRSKETTEILNFIDSIGAIDLTGEKDRQKRLVQMEAMRLEMIRQGGEVSKAKLREIARQKQLASNPYRRPSAIKRVIDENSGEMKYLYNRKLRSGQKISGKMTVQIRIAPDGRVANTSVVRSSLGDRGFEQEVCMRIEKWRFRPVPDSLGALTVNYPFEFYKEE